MKTGNIFILTTLVHAGSEAAIAPKLCFAFTASNFPSVKLPKAFKMQSVMQHMQPAFLAASQVVEQFLIINSCEKKLGMFGQHCESFMSFGGLAQPAGSSW